MSIEYCWNFRMLAPMIRARRLGFYRRIQKDLMFLHKILKKYKNINAIPTEATKIYTPAICVNESEV